jgi:hypothetical protein
VHRISRPVEQALGMCGFLSPYLPDRADAALGTPEHLPG